MSTRSVKILYPGLVGDNIHAKNNKERRGGKGQVGEGLERETKH
jgi:hypothetical protein